jgi:crossover junction endodeoxyribonuclease RusA
MAVAFTLPFPVKALWPNGRSHWADKAREVKKHREWARLAVVSSRTAKAPPAATGSRIALAVTVHPKTRNAIDRDNCVAALKSYIDGIADALGVDDRNFETPTITFGEPIKGGLFSVVLTVRAAQ